MKKHFIFLIAVFSSLFSYSQKPETNTEAIKLYVSIPPNTCAELNDAQKSRLESKIIQLVNSTGIADVGYSNFLVYPEFFVNDVSATQGGMRNMTVAQCELNIYVSRVAVNNTGGAHLATYSQKVTGSGTGRNDAITNAINQISTSDQGIVTFLDNAKVKIADYFKAHCNEVLQEAEQAYNLNNFAYSIALFFSIPSSAPCYKTARDKSVMVYRAFKNNECRKQLIELKGILAVAPNNSDTSISVNYDDAMAIVRDIDPTTDCYNEVQSLITKAESKFNESQKREWELRLKTKTNEAELQKEMVKAMGKMNAQYQPASPPIVIVNK